MNFDGKSKVFWSCKPSLYPILGGKTVEAGINFYRVKALACIPFKWSRFTFIPRVAIS
jgi:hypothetical protein